MERLPLCLRLTNLLLSRGVEVCVFLRVHVHCLPFSARAHVCRDREYVRASVCTHVGDRAPHCSQQTTLGIPRQLGTQNVIPGIKELVCEMPRPCPAEGKASAPLNSNTT